MRQSRPLQWIEEAEAREVLVAAVSEQSALLLPLAAPAGQPWVMRLRGRIFGVRAERPARQRRPPRRSH